MPPSTLVPIEPKIELILITAALPTPIGLSLLTSADFFNRGWKACTTISIIVNWVDIQCVHYTLVSIIGAVVFAKNDLAKSSALTPDNLVDLLAIPALLKSTFKPWPWTTFSTSLVTLSYELKSVTSVKK